jgi:flagellar basal-body rod protein FlgG
MWISKTGVQAQDAKLQAIANNLANVNTVGFKRDRVVFEDLFYQVDKQPGAQTADNTVSNGVQLGNGTHIVGTQKVFTNGSLQTTGQSLDVAISGNGFLEVRRPDGQPCRTPPPASPSAPTAWSARPCRARPRRRNSAN